MRIFVLVGLIIVVPLFWSISPANGNQLVVATATVTPKLGNTNTVLISKSNAEAIKEVVTLKSTTGVVYSAAFSPDSQILALGGDADTIRLVDVKTMQDLPPLTGQKPSIVDVAFSSDGKLLASGSVYDGSAWVWDIQTGQKISIHSGGIGFFDLAFSPDGNLLIGAEGGEFGAADVWEVATGETVTIISDSNEGFTDSVALSPDGKLLVVVKNGVIQLFPSATYKRSTVLKDEAAYTTKVVFSPDGKLLAASTRDDVVVLWDMVSYKPIQKFQLAKNSTGSASTLAFSPDWKLLVASSADKSLAVWDVAAGKQLKVLTGHTYIIFDVVFSPDGKLVASTSADETVRLWGVPTS